jgi:hypothetical protein
MNLDESTANDPYGLAPLVVMTGRCLADRLGIDPRSILKEPDVIVVTGKRRTPAYRITPAEVDAFVELKGRILGNSRG